MEENTALKKEQVISLAILFEAIPFQFENFTDAARKRFDMPDSFKITDAHLEELVDRGLVSLCERSNIFFEHELTEKGIEQVQSMVSYAAPPVVFCQESLTILDIFFKQRGVPLSFERLFSLQKSQYDKEKLQEIVNRLLKAKFLLKEERTDGSLIYDLSNEGVENIKKMWTLLNSMVTDNLSYRMRR